MLIFGTQKIKSLEIEIMNQNEEHLLILKINNILNDKIAEENHLLSKAPGHGNEQFGF